MDAAINTLFTTIKKILSQLNPEERPLSFLILTGKTGQGKSALLNQSKLEAVHIDTEYPTCVYYNQQGIIVELNEAWVQHNQHQLQYILKQLGRCHHAVKITGLLLCVDINPLLTIEPLQFTEHNQAHFSLLMQFGKNIGSPLALAIFFTKTDTIAGFCEFFQTEHANELQKPIGFSLPGSTDPEQQVNAYTKQFNQLIAFLGQQVIPKIHPVRSSAKRTLIREFPLQFTTLYSAIKSMVNTIPTQFFKLQAIYFTSAEQGGVNIDKLNKKIQHEYALTIQNHFAQSTNYRAYFITGAIRTFQSHTSQQITQKSGSMSSWRIAAIASITGLALAWIGQQHIANSRLLKSAEQELLNFDTLNHTQNQEASAIYHLQSASTVLAKISDKLHTLPALNNLNQQVHAFTSAQLNNRFIPELLTELEHTITDGNASHNTRYHALKIYLMFDDTKHMHKPAIISWFKQHWQLLKQNNVPNKLQLLQTILNHQLTAISVQPQIITDARNYLNALPKDYLYYTLAKDYLPVSKQAITFTGFELGYKELPVYFTKAGFQQVITELPVIAQRLQTENWVLARADLQTLPSILQSAYCQEYVRWWQNMMRSSAPQHIQNYQQARDVIHALHASNAIAEFTTLIQQHTSPDLSPQGGLFNQAIASQFTTLNLTSHTTMKELSRNLNELTTFLRTLSILQDHGKTAFELTKAHFQGNDRANPLTALYAHAAALPEPINIWSKQISDEIWALFINDTRHYINHQWQDTVYQDYVTTIAHRYPFETTQNQEVDLAHFDHFFGTYGTLNNFVEQYIKPFLDTSQPAWALKDVNQQVVPISADLINEIIRANVINNTFFPHHAANSNFEFTLQKLNLDPVVASLQLTLGNTKLYDSQQTESATTFNWPIRDAELILSSIDGNHYELAEQGPWAFFKMLGKVNVLMDEHDNSNLQILFEVNGNSGRYTLKTNNPINPFLPGILTGFNLEEQIA